MTTTDRPTDVPPMPPPAFLADGLRKGTTYTISAWWDGQHRFAIDGVPVEALPVEGREGVYTLLAGTPTPFTVDTRSPPPEPPTIDQLRAQIAEINARPCFDQDGNPIEKLGQLFLAGDLAPIAPPTPIDLDVAREYWRLRAAAMQRLSEIDILWAEVRLGEPELRERDRLRAFVQMSLGEWLVSQGRA